MANRRLVKWYGRRFKRVLLTRVHAAAHQIGAYILARTIQSMVPEPSTPGGPPARITSSYARSMDYEVGRKAGVITVRVGSNDKRVVWLELGTGTRSERGGVPYVIEPVRKKALHWVTPGGKDVITKKVIHPGIFPRPHLRPAMKKSRPFVIMILRHLL